MLKRFNALFYAMRHCFPLPTEEKSVNTLFEGFRTLFQRKNTM